MADLPKSVDIVHWLDKKYRVVMGGDAIDPITKEQMCPKCKNRNSTVLIMEFTQYGFLTDRVVELCQCIDCMHLFGRQWDYTRDGK